MGVRLLRGPTLPPLFFSYKRNTPTQDSTYTWSGAASWRAKSVSITSTELGPRSTKSLACLVCFVSCDGVIDGGRVVWGGVYLWVDGWRCGGCFGWGWVFFTYGFNAIRFDPSKRLPVGEVHGGGGGRRTDGCPIQPKAIQFNRFQISHKKIIDIKHIFRTYICNIY